MFTSNLINFFFNSTPTNSILKIPIVIIIPGLKKILKDETEIKLTASKSKQKLNDENLLPNC